MALLTKTQVGFPTVSYTAQDQLQLDNVALVKSADELTVELTNAYKTPHRVSTIRLAARIFPTQTITIGPDDTSTGFAGVIIEGSPEHKIVTSGFSGCVFHIQANATLRDLTIEANSVSNVFCVEDDSSLEILIDNCAITCAGVDGYAFNLPGTHPQLLMRGISIEDSTGDLSAAFGPPSSHQWRAVDFTVTSVDHLICHDGASYNPYSHLYLGGFLSPTTACDLAGIFSFCTFRDFLNFTSVDIISPGTVNTLEGFKLTSPGSGAIDGGSRALMIDCGDYGTITADSDSLIMAATYGSPAKSAYFPLRVGIGDTAPPVDLSVAGEIKISSDGTTAAAAGSGALRSVSGGLEVSNGTKWQALALADGYLTGSGAANQLARFTSSSNLSGITTAASRVLTTDGSSVISWSNSLPSGTTLNGSTIVTGPGLDGYVTGSGTANRLAYWSGTRAITSDSDFVVNASDGYVGIKTTPVVSLDVAGALRFEAAVRDLTATERGIWIGDRSFIAIRFQAGSTGDFTISNPRIAGQLLILLCSLATGSGTLQDSGNVKLSAAWSPGAGDTLMLVADSNTTWAQLGVSNN